MASGGKDCAIRLWDAATGTLLRILQGHTDVVASVVFSPDGLILASGGWDDTVRLWDVSAGTLRHILKGQRVVNSVAFSPDGQILASGGDDGTVLVWHPTKSRTVSGQGPASPSNAPQSTGR